jgi:hypothetical protein
MSSAYPDDIGGDINEVIVEETPDDLDRKKFVDDCEDFLDELSDSESSDETTDIETTIVPVRYTKDDKVEIDKDVYQLTIAALLTKDVGVPEYFYALRQAIYCFTFQSIIAIFFGMDYI